MIVRLYLLLEIISIILCLFNLYGKKFRLDIKTVLLISVYLILFSAINYYELNRMFTFLIYPIIWAYTAYEYGFNIKEIIINNFLWVIVIAVLQIIAAFAIAIFANSVGEDELYTLLVNGMTFFILVVGMRKKRLHRLSEYAQIMDTPLILIGCLIFAIVWMCLLSVKLLEVFNAYSYLLIFVLVALICVLVGSWEKYKIKSAENEIEAKTYAMYGKSFKNLIDIIRMRQHEFDNHIQVVYNMHYKYKNYEDLVNAQNEYISAINEENKYNKLLRKGNYVYSRFYVSTL